MFFSPAFTAYPAAGVTPPDKWALAPNFDTNWNAHNYYLGQGGAGGVTQLTGGRAGVSLAGGTQTTVGVNGVALWTANRAARGDFTATFKTKKTDGTATFAFETYLLFYFGVSGPGTAAHPTDMAQWPTTTQAASDTYKTAPITGARVTLYYQKASQAAEAEPVFPAVFPGDGTVSPLTASANFAFTGGASYSWTVQLAGNTLTISQTDGVSTNTHSVTDTKLAQYAKAGNFGLLSTAGRAIDVWDFSVDDGGRGNGTYLNGYTYRRWLRVAGDALGGARQARLPLWFDETLPSLKSVANGGNLQSAAGWDVRFEVGGVQVKHELEIYDPVAGRAAGWLDCSALAPGTDLDVAMYYGKPGLTASDADPAGLWSGWLGVWRMPDGNDMLGNGRHLVPSGTPSAGTILAMPAATLAAADSFRKADASYLDGQDQIALVVWHTPTSLANGGMMARVGGGASSASWAFWQDHGPDSPANGNTYTDYYGGSGTFSDGKKPNEYGQSGSATLSPTLVGMNLKAGAEPELWKNGAQLSSDLGASGSISGAAATIAISSTQDLTLGHNAGNNALAAVGAYGRFFLSSTTLDLNWWAFHYANVVAPHTVYGISDEDAAVDVAQSPIMGPVTVSAAASATTDLDALARTSTPDGGTPTAGLAPPNPSLGGNTASIQANRVRYVAGGTLGTDHLGITATQGTKTAKALMTVAVGGIGGGGNLAVAPRTERVTAWQLVKGSAGAAAITEGADANAGVVLRGGTAGAGNTGSQAIALVSVAVLKPGGAQGMYGMPFTLEFDYWRGATDPTPPDSNGIFCQLGLYRRNGGPSANLATFGSQDALGVWTADYSPTDAYFSNGGASPARARGIRFSFDTHSPGGGGDNQIRCKSIHVDGLVNGPLNIKESPQPTFDFSTRTDWTHLAWAFDGLRTVTVTATWPGGGPQTVQTFDDQDIQDTVNGDDLNVALIAYANRTAKFRDVTLTFGKRGGGGVIPIWADVCAPIVVRGGASRRDVTKPSDLPTFAAANIQYVVNNDINFSAAVDHNQSIGGGVIASTCYLRGATTTPDDPTSYPVLSNLLLTIRAKSIIITNLTFDNTEILLGDGAERVQIERCWFRDMDKGYDAGFVHYADGSAAVKNVLVAFNLTKPSAGGKVSSCTVRIDNQNNNTQTPGYTIPNPTILQGVTIFRNHIDGMVLGPDNPTSGGNSGRSRPFMFGNNPADGNRDLKCVVQENLVSNYNAPGPFIEIKYGGVIVKGNTLELGTVAVFPKYAAPDQLSIRIRHGKLSPPTTTIDNGIGCVIDGNLWVCTTARRTGLGKTDADTRDGFHHIINNWAVVTDSATAQPNAAMPEAPVGSSLTWGKLNWTTFPDIQSKGQNWMNSGRCQFGGNHLGGGIHVRTNGDLPGVNIFPPDQNRVGPVGGTSPSRNSSVDLTDATNSDRTGTVQGANYDLVPTRLMPDDVGPVAWSASFYP